MASIDWTDSTGAASLTNGHTGRLARFQGWTPLPATIADDAEALTGTRYAFVFAQCYDATFRLELIPDASVPTVARLIRHLLNAGTVSVTTGDTAARVYATCQAPIDAPPVLEMTDRALREWTLTLTLRNTAAAPGEMLCTY